MKQEMTQYTVALKNAPGQVHRVAAALAKEKINILGVSSETIGDVGYVRFVAEKGLDVRRALKDIGGEVFERKAFCVPLLNRYGELARLTKALAEAGVNVETLYATAGDEAERCRLVLCVDQAEKAGKVLSAFAEGLALAAR